MAREIDGVPIEYTAADIEQNERLLKLELAFTKLEAIMQKNNLLQRVEKLERQELESAIRETK